jgi:uncharacterized membrane protein YeaQ/YmgE (transglycosylase-associated protein family)
MMSFIWFVLIGGLAGWLAGKLTRGEGFGLLGNILVGIVGAVVGGFVFAILGIMVRSPLLGSLLTATVGAIIAIVVVRLISRR